MQRHPALVAFAAFIATIAGRSANAQAPDPIYPLTIHPDNSRYLMDRSGNLVYFTGSHHWSVFVDWGTSHPPPMFPYETFLNDMVADGHNFLRGWNWEHSRWIPWSTSNLYLAPQPYLRTGPGNALDGLPKFDLDQFDDAYFSEIRRRVQLAADRGIYVSIMLFQGWSFPRPNEPGDPWRSHPYHHQNNINLVDGDPKVSSKVRKETRLGTGLLVHTLEIPEVTMRQEAYVRRMIDELNHFDNIVWEISNESHDYVTVPPGVVSSRDWQYHMIDFIRDYESSKSKCHLIWMSGSRQFLNSSLAESEAELVSFGGDPYKQPPEASGEKVSILDTDHIWGLGGDHRWVWKSFLRGHHPIFMDVEYGLPLFPDPLQPAEAERERMRKAMGRTLSYAESMNLAAMEPRNELSTTSYCLAAPGSEYLVYQDLHSFTAGGNVFEVELAPGIYDYEHFDVYDGVIDGVGSFAWAGGWRPFDLPGRPILYLKNQAAPPPPPSGLVLEGENALLTGFAINSDPDTSGNSYIESSGPNQGAPNPEHRARFVFETTTAGEYRIKGRVRAHPMVTTASSSPSTECLLAGTCGTPRFQRDLSRTTSTITRDRDSSMTRSRCVWVLDRRRSTFTRGKMELTSIGWRWS